MLCDFHHTLLVTILYFKCISDCRQIFILKFYIDNRSHDLYNLTFCQWETS